MVIAVEGTQDVELAAALLKAEGFAKVAMYAELDADLQRLVTTEFPFQGDLYKRVPNPMFLRRGADWVAVRAAGGGAHRLSLVIEQVMLQQQLFSDTIMGLGVLCDADDQEPVDRLRSLLSELDSRRTISGFSLPYPDNPGEIAAGKPRFGVYVLPDNASFGTLDDLLIECGDVVYGGLLAGARTFVDRVDLAPLTDKDKVLFLKPAGRKKATVACAANILKPGMSIAVSIDQNRWLNDQTRNLPRVAALANFLRSLCGIA